MRNAIKYPMTQELIEKAEEADRVRADYADKCDWLQYASSEGGASIEVEVRTNCVLVGIGALAVNRYRIARTAFYQGSQRISRRAAEKLLWEDRA